MRLLANTSTKHIRLRRGRKQEEEKQEEEKRRRRRRRKEESVTARRYKYLFENCALHDTAPKCCWILNMSTKLDENKFATYEKEKEKKKHTKNSRQPHRRSCEYHRANRMQYGTRINCIHSSSSKRTRDEPKTNAKKIVHFSMLIHCRNILAEQWHKKTTYSSVAILTARKFYGNSNVLCLFIIALVYEPISSIQKRLFG